MELKSILGERTILIVDDVPSARKILAKFLEKGVGINCVQEASNGKQALELVNCGGVALVISDWEMPEMNGLELLKSVRSLEGDENKIPFLMITSKSEQNLVVEAAREGVSDYLLKPFNQSNFLGKIENLLRERIQLQRKRGRFS